MAEKQGYWDVQRCAWVDAEPTHVVPPAARGDAAAEVAVPEPRPSAEPALTADAPD
jgi:hypothetical protein